MGKFEYDVFLSHSSADNRITEELAMRLKADGVNVWLDNWILRPGDSIQAKIDTGLTGSMCLGLLLSKSSVSSAWTEFEQNSVRFRDPRNTERRFIPVLIEDCEIPDAIRQYKYVDYRSRSESAYRELLDAFTRRRVQHENEVSALDCLNLNELMKVSFDYILQRKRNPSQSSNTSMHFFGLSFNPNKPTVLPTAGIQAIGTELEHLEQVFWGEEHNSDKTTLRAQIADEIIDMLRDLFILAIAHELESWGEVDWFQSLEGGLSSESRNLSHHMSTFNLEYKSLLDLSLKEKLNRSNLRSWLTRALISLGGMASSCEVTVQDLEEDLRNRLTEDRGSPTSTNSHNSHPFLHKGYYHICKCSIPDYPGSYRNLLRRIHECGFDMWASASQTVIYREEAYSMIAIASGGSELPKHHELDEQLESLRNSVLFETPNRFGSNRLLLSLLELKRVRFDADTEGQLLKVVSEALKLFWESQIAAVSHLAP